MLKLSCSCVPWSTQITKHNFRLWSSRPAFAALLYFRHSFFFNFYNILTWHRQTSWRTTVHNKRKTAFRAHWVQSYAGQQSGNGPALLSRLVSDQHCPAVLTDNTQQQRRQREQLSSLESPRRRRWKEAGSLSFTPWIYWRNFFFIKWSTKANPSGKIKSHRPEMSAICVRSASQVL